MFLRYLGVSMAGLTMFITAAGFAAEPEAVPADPAPAVDSVSPPSSVPLHRVAGFGPGIRGHLIRTPGCMVLGTVQVAEDLVCPLERTSEASLYPYVLPRHVVVIDAEKNQVAEAAINAGGNFVVSVEPGTYMLQTTPAMGKCTPATVEVGAYGFTMVSLQCNIFPAIESTE